MRGLAPGAWEDRVRSRRRVDACARPLNFSVRRFLDTSSLLWGLLFGSIGLGYFIYGKKQKAVVPLVCGLALMLFPYFVSNTMVLVGIGALLAAIPCFLRL